jgi:hypothetical protein
MALTWPKLPLRPFYSSNPFLSLFERDYLEAASQTFPACAPLKNSSGLLAEWVSPSDGDIVAVSLTAGQNTTGATVKAVIATPDLELEGNFLGSAAADNVLAAGDLFLTRDLAKSTTLVDNATNPGWYIADTSSAVAVVITQFACNQVIPNVLQTKPLAGDTNARVFCKILAGGTPWT